MKRTVVTLAIVAAACSGGRATLASSSATTTTMPNPATATTTTPAKPATTPIVPATAARIIPSTTTVVAPNPASAVTTPGSYTGADLIVHLRFRSEVPEVTTEDLAAAAMAILTDPRGWAQSGFAFVLDEGSLLTVVLAEPARVDDLCLPLTTGGVASCQNGPVVALNSERWHTATEDWDASIAAYRTYLISHEVGHLIGLRHPVERCPDDEPTSAVMEPQTAGLVCAGNGWPLPWEVTWAANRPAEVGPLPEWDGPRPRWP